MKRILLALALTASLTAEAQQRMTLADCINYAVERNVDVKQQDVTRRNQELTLHTARHSRLPQLSAAGNQSFDFGRGLTSENTYVSRNTQSTSFSLNANLPLITGGRIPNQVAQARLDLAAATADLERLRDDLSIQVAGAYLEALYQKAMLRTATEQVALSRKQLERIEAFFKNDKASAAEVAEARSRVATDELSRVQADNSFRLALLTLSQLIELPAPDSLDICEPEGLLPAHVDGSPDAIFAAAVATRPGVRADSLRIESAERGVRIARSSYWPTLSIGAGLGTTYYRTNGFDNAAFGRQLRDNFSKTVGLSLSIPIFNRFTTRNAVRQAELTVESRRWQLDATRKALYKEIQQAWYNAVAAQAQFASSNVAVEEAQTAFELMTKKYETGKANATEYDESRTKRLRAEYDRLAARYQYMFRMKILDFYRGVPLA